MILLGNLSIEQIEQRLDIKFSETDKERLKSFHSEKTDVARQNAWHCFDIPFIIVCGTLNTVSEVMDILTPYSSKMKTKIQIGLYD